MAKTNKELRDEAVALAAECWTDPETEHLTMIPELAEAVAKRFLKLLKRIDNLKSVSEPPAPPPPGELMTVEAASVAVLGGVDEPRPQYYFACLERIAELTGRELSKQLEDDVIAVLERRPAEIDIEKMLKRRAKADDLESRKQPVAVASRGASSQIALAPDIPTPTVENLTPPN